MDFKGEDMKGCRATLVLMAFVAMMVMFIDIMLVPALQHISMSFPDNSEWISWILSIYLLVGAVLNPIVGKLADLYGKKKVLLVTLVIYTVGLAGCALTYGNFVCLIAFRAMQGIGLTMFPIFYGIIRDTFPKEMVPMSIGIVSAMFSIGVSIGLLGGGWIVSRFDWQYCYYITAPLFLILIPIFYLKVKDAGIFIKGRKVDYFGAGMLSVCILSLLIALTVFEEQGSSSTMVLSCLAFFIVSLVSFVYWERRAAEPLMKLGLLTGKGAGAHVTAFLFGISMFMLFQTLPYFLAGPEVYGGFRIEDTFDIGLIMMPMAVMGLIFGPLAGKWCRKPGNSLKVLSAGMLLFGIGDLMLIILLKAFPTELWTVVFSMSVAGIGNALAMVSMINVVVETSPAEDFGIASGMNTMFRLIGGSIGPVLGTAILSGFVVFEAFGLKYYGFEGYVWTWAAGMLFCLAGAVSAYMLKPKAKTSEA
ncbi:MAG: MFS transporter [Candidatus Methanomethylophilaceae archaeon]|nr:MFS transporter [Candidatus Methanomethylophilaceae archaeon]